VKQKKKKPKSGSAHRGPKRARAKGPKSTAKQREVEAMDRLERRKYRGK
jgi:hypothetical protein